MANSFPPDTSKFKLIVSDFDGTLAGPEHIVTPKVVAAVKRWIDSGRHFTIATGRQFLMLEDECQKMGLIDPVIVRAGSEVVDPTNRKVLHSELIDKNIVSQVLEMLNKNDKFDFNIDVDDTIYTNFEFKYAYIFPKIKFVDIREFELKDIAKFHLKPKDEKDNGLDEFVKEIELKFPQLHAIATHNKTFGKGWDLTSTRATKLFGIVKVMEQLNIKREEVVGVGDSYNDFPLLEAAGFKVAMGNAVEEIKAVADFTVSSHIDDGVAELIDRLLKYKQ